MDSLRNRIDGGRGRLDPACHLRDPVRAPCLKLGVRLSVEAQYQVCLGDHAGEFLVRIEHRNMVMAISGEYRHELGDRSGDADRGRVGRHDGRYRQR